MYAKHLSYFLLLFLFLLFGCSNVIIKDSRPELPSLSSSALYNYDIPNDDEVVFPDGTKMVIQYPCFFPLKEFNKAEVTILTLLNESEVVKCWWEVVGDEDVIRFVDYEKVSSYLNSLSIPQIDELMDEMENGQVFLRFVYRTKKGGMKNCSIPGIDISKISIWWWEILNEKRDVENVFISDLQKGIYSDKLPPKLKTIPLFVKNQDSSRYKTLRLFTRNNTGEQKDYSIPDIPLFDIATYWWELLDEKGELKKEIVLEDLEKRKDLLPKIELSKSDFLFDKSPESKIELRFVLRTISGDIKEYEAFLNKNVEAPYGTSVPSDLYIEKEAGWKGCRYLLYGFVGLPRDILDAPFTFLYNHYQIAEFAGVIVGIGWWIYSLYETGGMGPHFAHFFSRDIIPILEGLGIGLFTAFGPGVFIPVETSLFRYPADKNFFGFKDKIEDEDWIKRSDTHYLDKSPLAYFPNYHYLFRQKSYKYLLDEEKAELRKKVTTTYKIWYSLELPE